MGIAQKLTHSMKRGGNPSLQSNDVEVDRRGPVYLIDRNRGFDIIEVTG